MRAEAAAAAAGGEDEYTVADEGVRMPPAAAGRNDRTRSMQPTRNNADHGQPGSLIVVGILAMAAGLAAFAVWFQWTQTRRCLGFFGPGIATAIQTAPRVEAWRLSPKSTPDGSGGRVVATSREDVSQARGLVHLRHGLVEDSNYAWSDRPAGRRPIGAWDVALAFYDTTPSPSGAASQPAAVLAFDLEGDGAVTVVGRPGSVVLGRLGPGLRDWMAATFEAGPTGR